MITEKLFLIWSLEHKQWWAPHERGYVTEHTLAGRYPFIRALEILEGANVAGFNEAIVPDGNTKLWDRLERDE